MTTDSSESSRTPFASQFINSHNKAASGSKLVDLDATRSSNDLNDVDSHQLKQSQLLTGLKNLSIKQQERVYSASKIS